MDTATPSPPKPSTAIRLGYVKYLNTLPLVEGLQALRNTKLIAAVPSRLGDMLQTGQVDIALTSLVDFARATVPFTLLPVGMIGCDGPTLTVRLFSRVPLDRVTTLHADTDSHTSVILAQVILAKQFGVKSPKIIDFDAREQTPESLIAAGAPETILLIGDKVVSSAPQATHYPHELDLGAAWHTLTGLPFVYAMWMAREADLDGPRRESIASVASLLDRQRRRNLMRLDWLVDRYAEAKGWPRDLARRYITEYLRYTVGPRERDAVAAFLTAAADLDLLPRVAPRFAGDLAPV